MFDKKEKNMIIPPCHVGLVWTSAVRWMYYKQISRLAALARDDTEENLGPMKLIFNYENVFYSFFYDDVSGCIHRSREYAMNYVYSGEMILDNGKEQIHVGKGECVYIPRDHHITMYKRTADGERYCGIFMNFIRSFLKEMYTKLGQYRIPSNTPKLESGVVKLPKTA